MEAVESQEGASLAAVALESEERKVEGHEVLATAMAVGPTPMAPGVMGVHKKKGRPRKYGPDGSLLLPLSLMPISSSAPGEFLYTSSGKSLKRGRGRTAWSRMFMRPEFGILGELPPGVNFMPHVLKVDAGEDITTKIMAFSQQGPRAVCILSCIGVISIVTLRQPDSSGGTLTYEGRFELLSLSGSFMPTENGEIRSRSGGISVCLASPDGRVIGGGLAGLLVAACPMQAVVASFIPHSQSEQMAKWPRPEAPTIHAAAVADPIPDTEMDGAHVGFGHHISGVPRTSFVSTMMRVDHWASPHSTTDSRETTEINVNLHA